ncbi:hypothetical protein NM688_g6204 [Phlebia brevispora]|uniref:Uncharacterized protein n=1 Tax=Phlebia brevispora TaxID=194682 RepID=A0ACC1SIQ3_9APHY|nr:hypothetical protein NM688_g6204 [Phlebia brevispora]
MPSTTARHVRSKPPPRRSGSDRHTGAAFDRRKLTEEEHAKLAELMSEKYGWNGKPHPFQLAGTAAQLEGIDTVIQAPTGAGKTAVVAGPHVWPACAGMVTLLSVPIIALGEEFVKTFDTEFGLKAVAINSKNGSLSPQVAKDILAGKYSVVIASPEMLQSRSFVNRILRNSSFTRRVISLVVDEAHCVSHWGASFRKKYGTLGVVRAFLPRGTPVIALTATLTARVRRDIQAKLYFKKSTSQYINVGNDRPNVSIVVRACEHPLNTYADLNFVLPTRISDPKDIPKTYIYVDNIATGNEIIDHMTELLAKRTGSPTDVQQGWIRPFNSNLSHEYRQEAMDRFRDGTIRILVCTDAAGMGCNMPDVDLVVQWKLPATFSTFIQRAGRAARGRNRHGLAVLLVERSAFSVNLGEGQKRSSRARTKAQRFTATAYKAADEAASNPRVDRKKAQARKQYAEAHGVNRGGLKHLDSVPTGAQPPLDLNAEDEGLLSFVQSTLCRRAIWAEAFDNDPKSLKGMPAVPCCDVCDHSLFDQARPGVLKARASTETPPTKGMPDFAVQKLLRKWRETIFSRDLADTALAPSAVLSDELIEAISCFGPIPVAKLRSAVEPKWAWWSTYGKELVTHLATLPLQFKARPRKSRHAEPQENGAPASTNYKWKEPIVSAPAEAMNDVPPHGDIQFVYAEGRTEENMYDVTLTVRDERGVVIETESGTHVAGASTAVKRKKPATRRRTKRARNDPQDCSTALNIPSAEASVQLNPSSGTSSSELVLLPAHGGSYTSTQSAPLARTYPYDASGSLAHVYRRPQARSPYPYMPPSSSSSSTTTQGPPPQPVYFAAPTYPQGWTHSPYQHVEAGQSSTLGNPQVEQ